jgi:hypothetical protein
MKSGQSIKWLNQKPQEEEMLKFIFLGVLLSSSPAPQTQGGPQPLNVKTGLWQVTMTTTIQGQRPSTTTYNSCVKKEDLDKYPFTNPDFKCTWTVQTSTSSRMDAKGTCMTSDGKVDFNIQLDALSTESVKGTGQMSMQGPAGAIKGSYAATAKFVSGACGKEK